MSCSTLAARPARSDVPDPHQERMDALSEAIVRLLKRQQQVDQRLARIETALNLQPPPEPVPPPAKLDRTPPVIPPIAEPARPIVDMPQPVSQPLETNIGLTLVNRIGVITLVLGVGFFFKWAVENQWIGPAGRVLLSLAAGVVALGIADLLWRKGQQIFAQGLTAVGLGILYLAAYASFGFYHLVSQSVAFFFLSALTLLAIALALRYASAAMAVLGLLGGYLTPLLLSNGENRPWFLFSYLLVLDCGALFLARTRILARARNP